MALKTVIYPVHDLAATKAVFSALLGEPYIDEPYYVAFDADGQDIGLDPNGHAKGLTGPTPFIFVEDIDKSVEVLLAAGATKVQDVQDVGQGNRIASVKDADGNLIGLFQTA